MGVKLSAFIAGIGLMVVGCADSAPTEVGPDYKSKLGKTIYTERCITCHGHDGKLGSGGAKDLSISKMDSTSIADIIKNGKNAMPRQGKYIATDEEMANVVEFVKSLKK